MKVEGNLLPFGGIRNSATVEDGCSFVKTNLTMRTISLVTIAALLITVPPAIAQEATKQRAVGDESVVANAQEVKEELPASKARVLVDGNSVSVDGKPWAKFTTGMLTGGSHLTVKVSRKDASKAETVAIANIEWGEQLAYPGGPTFPVPDYPRYFSIPSKSFGVVQFIGPCQVVANYALLMADFKLGENEVQFEIHWTESATELEPKKPELERFRERYPMRLKWPDRRPIGVSFPNQYIGNGKTWIFDASTPKKFEQGITAHVDACIANCKAVDAQGLIIWSIEGQYLPHPISYIGDPEKHAEFAPELTPELAARLFKKITDAGLLPGVTVRPQELVQENGKWVQKEQRDDEYLATLRRKIKFAHDTWGCRLFYIDSTTQYLPEGTKLPSFKVMATLHEEFPDCLLIPEQWAPAWLTVLCGWTAGIDPMPADYRYAYPNAFQLLFGQNVDWTKRENVEKLQAAIKDGNIPTFNAWYKSPDLQAVKTAIKKSQAEPSR